MSPRVRKPKPPAPSRVLLDKLIQLSEKANLTTCHLSVDQTRTEYRLANNLLRKFADGVMTDPEVVNAVVEYLEYMFSIRPQMFVGTFHPFVGDYHVNRWKMGIKKAKDTQEARKAATSDFIEMRKRLNGEGCE
jgi:hypothetical protein